MAGAGTQTAALASGGDTGSIIANSEEYNGTSWTEGNDLNTARKDFSGSGLQTLALVFGGNPTTGATEQYDGTSYTTTASLATARRLGAGAGTGSLALYSAGQPTNSTEEFTDTTEPVRSFDVS
jgi:hypothetical protein